MNYLLYDNINDDDFEGSSLPILIRISMTLLTDLNSKQSYKLCLMTFSNPMEIEPLKGFKEQFDLEFVTLKKYIHLVWKEEIALINFKEPLFADAVHLQ